jgi:cytochrome b pre-mRNA-processing protein 3
MLRFFFRNRQDPAVAALYGRAVEQARSPAFYQSFGVADTIDGRFEMVVLHVAALVDALRDEAGALRPEGQALFDAFLADMEQNLRTIGVGDMSVPKKMKKMGQAFYGRFDAYRSAEGRDARAAAMARNVLDAPVGPEAFALADYWDALAAAAPRTAAQPFAFPDPRAFAPQEVAA